MGNESTDALTCYGAKVSNSSEARTGIDLVIFAGTLLVIVGWVVGAGT